MNNRRFQFVLIYLILYAAVLFLGPRLFPNLMPAQRQAPSPMQIEQKIQTLRAQALKAEQDAHNTQLSLSDRAKKWDDALRDYRDIEHLGGKTDVAIDAKFQQARVFEERARSDTKNTGDYDQAERIYKDLARHHPGDRAAITINGAATPVVVGQYAQERLDIVLKERDQRSRHNPLYRVLDFFVMVTGRIPGFSYWFALLLITILIKLILFPFTKRQFKNMADMQRIAPKMKELQEKLKGRPADEINRKVMALYKDEGVNPAAGCAPLIAQMVALYPLYMMIRMYEYQFRNGYFLWIGSAFSHQHPQWIATSLAFPDVILLVLYCISMALTSKLQPPAADPQQAQMQKSMTYLMPIIFGAMTWNFAWPSAFTFYWLVLNLISTAQQWHILKTVHPTAATAPAASARPGDSGPSKRGGSGGSNGRDGGNGARPVKPSGSRSGGAKKSSRR